MHLRKSWLLFFLLSGYFIDVFSQLSFDHLSVSHGLSQSTVLSICKDNKGYMWFGTRDGINRYDGRTIKTYRHDDKKQTSISADDYIYIITKLKDKNLWIGTQNGLNCYYPETDTFEKIYHNEKDPSSISSNAVLSIYEAKNGKIWLGTNKGLSLLANAKFRKFSNFYVKDGLAGNEVYSIFEDSKGNIWVGTTTGLTQIKAVGRDKYQFVNFFHKSSAPLGLSGNSIKTIVEDKEGNIWIGTERNGISIYHPQQHTFSYIQQNSSVVNGLSNNFIRKIIIDKDGKFWIATMDGLNIYDPQSKSFTVYKHDSENRKSLSDNSIKDIYEDEQGSVWIGTNFGGISVAHKTAVPFEVYRHSKYRNSISNDIHSAKTALTRFDPKIGLMKSWNAKKSWDGKTTWQYPVIIDNMMNLEMLCYVSKLTGDPVYKNAAISHALNTMKNHFRADYSTYHVVDYEPQTGKVLHQQTNQGYADNSTWARGQGWAIYGFTMMYRETGDKRFLETAKKAANFYINHPNLPKDKIPYWDFNVGQNGYKPDWDQSNKPQLAEIPRDASAGALVASALLELSKYAGKQQGQVYFKNAETMLKSLSGDKYLAKPGTNAGFILKHSVGSFPHNSEIDVPLIYADYYFLEALLRYQKLAK